MSELTQKLLEAGIIRKHAAQLLQKWGGLSEESVAVARDDEEALELTEQAFTRFASEIDEILEKEDVGKPETSFDGV